MTSLRELFTAWLLLVPASGLIAQATVSGRVTDCQSGEPLPGVHVILGKNSGTSTDANGLYSFPSAPGTVTVSFSYIGYRSLAETLNIRDGENLVLNVALEPEVLSLDMVVVSVDRMEQKRSDLTVSMDVVKSEYLYRTHITDA